MTDGMDFGYDDSNYTIALLSPDGEVVATSDGMATQLAPEFANHTLLDKANIATYILADRQREVESLKAQKKAIAEAFDKRITKAESQLHWAHEILDGVLEDASEAMGKGESKFVDTPYGRIKRITSRGKVEVVDEEKALAYAKEFCPEAIKTTILVSMIPAPMRESLLHLPATGIVVHPMTTRLGFTPSI